MTKAAWVELSQMSIYLEALADDRSVIFWRGWLTTFFRSDSEDLHMPELSLGYLLPK